MITLERSMNHKWIIDKNVNSTDLLSDFAILLNNHSAQIGFDFDSLVSKAITQGRASRGKGSPITIGVRLLQTCFYMFGYSKNVETDKHKKIFMPSPMLLNIISAKDEKDKEKNLLVNLFCMQYPHPYDWTPECFDLYFGRLIIKLLLDSRLKYKLYIDECIWFLPFIEKIDEMKYESLVESILQYRSFSYEKKLSLFQSVENYEKLFANVLHEINYYLLRLFAGFNVLHLIEDKEHNGGRIFKFLHSQSIDKKTQKLSKTYRNDAYQSGKKYSGYVELSRALWDSAKLLLKKFSPFDHPSKIDGKEIFTKEDWITNLYQTEPLRYLSVIDMEVNSISKIINIVNEMIRTSRFGSSDGKEFENALKPFIELFRENLNVEILSGAGNTDLLCTMMKCPEKTKYNMNIDAKTREKAALEGVHTTRINKHMRKTGSLFCIIVAPRFSKGVLGDITGNKIVVVRAEEFGNYCYNECKNSSDHFHIYPVFFLKRGLF